MAQPAESGFDNGEPGSATVAVEPRKRTVIVSSGVMPSMRKYHQQGQPRAGSPPGMQSMRRAAWSIASTLTEPPSKSAATVNGSAAEVVAVNVVKERLHGQPAAVFREAHLNHVPLNAKRGNDGAR